MPNLFDDFYEIMHKLIEQLRSSKGKQLVKEDYLALLDEFTAIYDLLSYELELAKQQVYPPKKNEPEELAFGGGDSIVVLMKFLLPSNHKLYESMLTNMPTVHMLSGVSIQDFFKKQSEKKDIQLNNKIEYQVRNQALLAHLTQTGDVVSGMRESKVLPIIIKDEYIEEKIIDAEYFKEEIQIHQTYLKQITGPFYAKIQTVIQPPLQLKEILAINGLTHEIKMSTSQTSDELHALEKQYIKILLKQCESIEEPKKTIDSSESLAPDPTQALKKEASEFIKFKVAEKEKQFKKLNTQKEIIKKVFSNKEKLHTNLKIFRAIRALKKISGSADYSSKEGFDSFIKTWGKTIPPYNMQVFKLFEEETTKTIAVNFLHQQIHLIDFLRSQTAELKNTDKSTYQKIEGDKLREHLRNLSQDLTSKIIPLNLINYVTAYKQKGFDPKTSLPFSKENWSLLMPLSNYMLLPVAQNIGKDLDIDNEYALLQETNEFNVEYVISKCANLKKEIEKVLSDAINIEPDKAKFIESYIRNAFNIYLVSNDKAFSSQSRMLIGKTLNLYISDNSITAKKAFEEFKKSTKSSLTMPTSSLSGAGEGGVADAGGVVESEPGIKTTSAKTPPSTLSLAISKPIYPERPELMKKLLEYQSHYAQHHAMNINKFNNYVTQVYAIKDGDAHRLIPSIYEQFLNEYTNHVIKYKFKNNIGQFFKKMPQTAQEAKLKAEDYQKYFKFLESHDPHTHIFMKSVTQLLKDANLIDAKGNYIEHREVKSVSTLTTGENPNAQPAKKRSS